MEWKMLQTISNPQHCAMLGKVWVAIEEQTKSRRRLRAGLQVERPSQLPVEELKQRWPGQAIGLFRNELSRAEDAMGGVAELGCAELALEAIIR